MGNLGTQAASVGLYPKLAYDPRTDFEPIINTAGTPMLVVAKKDLPVKDFKEFVDYVKTNAAQDELRHRRRRCDLASHLPVPRLAARRASRRMCRSAAPGRR